MFNTAKDFKDYIKQTLKSKGACSAPSQEASIWQTYRSKKFHPVADTYHPVSCDVLALSGSGKVVWKNANGACEQNNGHMYCAFYLGYVDKILCGMPIFFIHFEFDTNNIYNVGVEFLKYKNLLNVSKTKLIQHIFNVF